MIRALCLALATLAAGQAAAGSVIADVICDDRARMVAKLKGTFGAAMLGRGMRGPDAVLEVWSSARTGDWLLVQTYADGLSCIVAMGEDWESLALARDPA